MTIPDSRICGPTCPSCGRDNSDYDNICTSDDCPGIVNHPSILAFGYSYLPEGGVEPSYDIVNAPNLGAFQVITLKEIDVTLLDVHHVSATDGFTITDIVWNRDHNPTPYTDTWANNSWVFSDMDRIAYGKS